MKLSDMVQLFNSLVRSILLYASVMWGFHEATNVELIQNKFFRKLLGVKRSTNLIGMYGELGSHPLSVTRKCKTILYWAHILRHASSLQLKVDQMWKEDANSGKSYNGQNWVYQVKSSLDELGLPYIFIDQNDVQVPQHVIRTRIHDQYIHQWRSGLEASNRLQYYCKIKETLEFEKYPDVVDDPLLKKKLTRFRLSST
jgi:hypothetical protein